MPSQRWKGALLMSKGVSRGAVMSKYWFAGTCPDVNKFNQVYMASSIKQSRVLLVQSVSSALDIRQIYSGRFFFTLHHLASFQPSYVKEGLWKSFGMSWHFRIFRFLDSIKLRSERQLDLAAKSDAKCPSLDTWVSWKLWKSTIRTYNIIQTVTSPHHLMLDHSFANAGPHFISDTEGGLKRKRQML